MPEFKSGETITFDLTDLAHCIFLFGETAGRDMWEKCNNPIVVTNPHSSCVVTGVDVENNTIYLGSPQGYQIKTGR